jgi:hypothetical protein
MPKNARQADSPAGILLPNAVTETFRMMAASPTRKDTIVNGGNALTWTPMKKNEPPHSTDNSRSTSHSLPLMRRFTVSSVISFLSV